MIPVCECRTAEDAHRLAREARARRAAMYPPRSIVIPPRPPAPKPAPKLAPVVIPIRSGGEATKIAIARPGRKRDFVFRFAAAAMGVSVDRLTKRARSIHVIRPRQFAAWLVREATGASLPVVGRMIGGYDHTTILHACRVTESRRVTDPGFDALCQWALAEVERRWKAGGLG